MPFSCIPSLATLCRYATVVLTLLTVSIGGAMAQSATPAPSATPSPAPSNAPVSAFAPVVLQGCARHITGNGSLVFPYKTHFDLSFQNISAKTANAVMVRIGGSDFVKTGAFAANSVTVWRIDAASFGTFDAQNCSIKAVRFVDGSEWDAPQE